jgi:O-antigen/teichoic acid export membrane protein
MTGAEQPAKADTHFEALPPERPAADAGEAASAGETVIRAQLLVNGFFHYAGQIASVISGIVLVPLMLNHLGPEVYGFWVLAFSIPGFVLGLDTILYFPIVRKVAAHRDCIPETTSLFLSACCGVYFCSGALCAAVTVVGGFAVTGHMHLSATTRAAIPAVLSAVAVGFIAGRLQAFANAVLAGRQMFQVMNSISVAVLIVRTSVIVFLLLHGHSLILIAASYAALSIVEVAIALGFTYKLRAFRPKRVFTEWSRLREIGEFGVVSFLATLVQNIWWFSPQLLVGLLSGNTSANASLYAGQRPCFVISDLNWRGADVLFAAAASQAAEKDKKRISEVLDFGGKNVLAIALPLAVGLFFFAPALVRVWLGAAAPLTVNIMRFTSIGIVADALWVGPLHVMWALGRARRVLIISLYMASASMVIDLPAIHWFGPVGAALTFSLTAWLGTIFAAIEVARELGISWRRCLLRPFTELAIPILLLTGYCLAVLLLSSNPWVTLLSGSAGGALYVILFVIKQRKSLP